MAKNIVYIQANDKVAASFKEMFAERGVELNVAKSAEEALSIMGRQDVGLLLVDINIPDMRLSKLVEICSRDYPTVILNVCVDVVNSLLVTKLVNRHAIHKIFVAPWDVREMIEEIEESLDAAEISREQVLHEKKIMAEDEQFHNTLSMLTKALEKQQFSYGKIRAITDLVFAHEADLREDASSPSLLPQFKQIFDVYLRMQTKDAMPIDRFEETIRSDFEKLMQGRSGYTMSEISSCLAEDTPKVRAVNLRFVIWLIVYLTICEAAKQENAAFDFAVTSEETGEHQVTFTVVRTGIAEKKIPFLEQYLLESIRLFADADSHTEEEHKTIYRITVNTGRNAS